MLNTEKPSISLVQRHLSIGYNRAARLLEMMENQGLISAMNSSGTRTLERRVKYRGPNGETWTGRGLMPRWVKVYIDGGGTLADLTLEDVPV